MILEVQNTTFRRTPAPAHYNFHFQKIPGGLNINAVHEASFYIKEQTQKNWYLSFKNYSFPPPLKSAFLVFEENPPPPQILFIHALALNQL